MTSDKFTSAIEAENWINGERWKGEKRGLENVRALLHKLGSPQKHMGKVLHVAGTNGKGSVSAFLAGGLMECGYSVGLFTSPYLRRFNERIMLNGSPVSDNELVHYSNLLHSACTELTNEGVFPTTFELLTALACMYYADKGTDYAVMEVGLGGRLDATNALDTDLSLIAAIGLDHMSVLGNTVEEISKEKAGIMRPGVTCVVMPQSESILSVFSSHASQIGAPLYQSALPSIISQTVDGCSFALDLPLRGSEIINICMAGAYQAYNASLALTGLDLLNIDMEKAAAGVSKTRWAGRLDLRGNTLVDCAHNPQGMTALKEYAEMFFHGRRRVGLIGMMKDKQVDACAAIFQGFTDEIVATNVAWPRAMSAKELATRFYKPCHAFGDVRQAFDKANALAGDDGLVICAGSVYLAGDVINILEGSAYAASR
ncbi:MAG: bifunctional folylpolyglutamate synthase/dihydrofolate synthase [Clostridiales bacterium]|nr:bifunctional folylpolyglutamate synthase/dihydrofolate synthase [Clostridiales bacterium]